MTNPTEYVPVRLRPDQLTAIDEAVKKLGGNRSDFIRRAVEMRLEWVEQMQQISTLPVAVKQ